MAVPQFPITRIECYLDAIYKLLGGVVPEVDDMKVLYFEEVVGGMAVREGDKYATFAEFIESLNDETVGVIPVYLYGRPALAVNEETGAYSFLIAEGISSGEQDTVLSMSYYTIETEPDSETGLYDFTAADYSITLTVVE